jgi:hypothetical protein
MVVRKQEAVLALILLPPCLHLLPILPSVPRRTLMLTLWMTSNVCVHELMLAPAHPAITPPMLTR